MGNGILQYNIQDQYIHHWVERLTEFLKDYSSISISHVHSKIDLEQGIYNTCLNIHYRSATIVVFGDGPVKGQFSVLIVPKQSKSRADLEALLDIVKKNIKSMLQDEPPPLPRTYGQELFSLLVECYLLIVSFPLLLLIFIACLVSIGIGRIRRLFGIRNDETDKTEKIQKQNDDQIYIEK